MIMKRIPVDDSFWSPTVIWFTHDRENYKLKNAFQNYMLEKYKILIEDNLLNRAFGFYDKYPFTPVLMEENGVKFFYPKFKRKSKNGKND